MRIKSRRSNLLIGVEHQWLLVVEIEQRAICRTKQEIVHHRAEIRNIPLAAVDTAQQRFAGQHDISLAIRARLLNLLALCLGGCLAGLS